MANDCLVTKLKASVNKPELERFGYKRIFARLGASNENISILNSSSMTVIRMDENYADVETTTKEPNASYFKSGAFGKCYFDISNPLDVCHLRFYGCATTGSYDPIVNGDFPNLTEFDSLYSNAGLDIKLLSTIYHLETLMFNGSTGVYGKIEELLEGMCGKGRTSGSLAITTNNNIKFNNTYTANASIYTVTFSAGGCTVSFDDATVGTYDGASWTYNN